jgi:uncharacterized protein YlzI (FlbEa/FlbD family)
MTFIKLTPVEGPAQIYIQASFIVKFQMYGKTSTKISLSNGEKVDVKESPEELMDLLDMFVAGVEIETLR